MRQQDFWDDGSPFTLHNFNQEEVILHNFEEPKPEPQPAPKKKKYQPLEEITPQEIKVPIKEMTVAPEHKVRKKPKSVTLLYCLPANTVDTHDPLYNENRISVSYGAQFTFEAVVTGSTDLSLQIWTTKEMNRNSIIYQPVTRRWWKVEEVVQKTDGFVIDCTPSAIQPSFRLQP